VYQALEEINLLRVFNTEFLQFSMPRGFYL